MKILVSRPDRIGDVILSTPTFRAVKQALPDAKLSVLVRSNVAPLLQIPAIDEVLEYSESFSVWTLARLLRAKKFDAAVALQSNRKIAAAMFLARIPRRVGPYSKLHSFLFYNAGARQHRSEVRKHEAEYNLELLEKIGVKAQLPLRTEVGVSPDARARAKNFLTGLGLEPGQKLVAVHPGMGGSAFNWPVEFYADLVKRLAESKVRVLVTSGPMDRVYLSELRGRLGAQINQVWFFEAGESDSIEFLGALYRFCHVVVAPSTGPLHLAVALGVPTVSFYPSIRVQSAARWGPYPPDVGKNLVFTPEGEMNQIPPERVFDGVQGFLG